MISKALEELRVARTRAYGVRYCRETMSLIGAVDRLLAEPLPRAITDAEKALCDEAGRDKGRRRQQLESAASAVYAERHPKPRTLEDVNEDILDFTPCSGPIRKDHDKLQVLFDERRKLLDEA